MKARKKEESKKEKRKKKSSLLEGANAICCGTGCRCEGDAWGSHFNFHYGRLRGAMLSLFIRFESLPRLKKASLHHPPTTPKTR